MIEPIKLPHRKKRKSYNIEGHAHELTFSCYHHYSYLGDRVACEMIMEELLNAKIKFHFYIWAYVLMPTHVHLLILPMEKEYKISSILQMIKGKMSTRYGNFLREKDPEQYKNMCLVIKEKTVFRFWQAGGGFDRNLWSPKAIHASIRYIEENPVRAGLVQKPEQWLWSSAYARKNGKGLVPDQNDIPILMI